MWIYIPAAELETAGRTIAPDEPLPTYRLWGRARGTVIVRIYRRS